MRTYSRKKPENKVIEGVLEMCRLCLEKTAIRVPLFPDISEEDFLCALPLRIMMCVGLEIQDEECLPKAICMECFQELERNYLFRKKCEVVYQKLKSHLQATKDKEIQKIHETETVNKSLIDLNDKEQDFQYNHIQNSIIPNGSLNHMIIGNETSIVKIQDNAEVITNVSALEIDASNTDMALILSTILIELGVLHQEDNDLKIVDGSLKYVELEGDDSTKIVLELVEEDEEQSKNNYSSQEVQMTQNSGMILEEESDTSPPQWLLDVNPPEVKKQRAAPRCMRSWECNACGRRLASRSALLRHARRHSGERPFPCAVCHRAFTQREVMLRHALVHQARRPFACTRCPKSFTQRNALEAHQSSHIPAHLRPLALHACPACDKVFLHASGLSRHMSTHSGREYACDTCARHFRDKSSLLRHLRRGHAPKAKRALRAAQRPAATAAPLRTECDASPKD